VPFVAYLPTEHLGGSGLVAAVAAGITAGQGAARWSTPEQRVSDQLNWRTLELLLEGAVFLIMGLELRDIVSGNMARYQGIGVAVALALAALAIVLVVRALYVSGLVLLLGRRARRMQRDRLQAFSDRLDAFDPATSDIRELRPAREERPVEPIPRGGFVRRATGRAAGRAARRWAKRAPDAASTQRRVDGVRNRVGRLLNDMDYYQGSPLGWKHGVVIVWAGMRGVVTLAAAQTLDPETTPARELLILIAFVVALVSLMLQGLTLPWVIRTLRMPAVTGDGSSSEESDRLDDELRQAALAHLRTPGLADSTGTPFPPDVLATLAERMGAPRLEAPEISTAAVIDLRISLLEAMRDRLVDVSREGSYSSAALRHALAQLDADQLSIQLRREADD